MKPVSLNMVRDDKGRFVRNTAPPERSRISIIDVLLICAWFVIGWEVAEILVPHAPQRPDYSNLTVTLSDGYVTPPPHVGTCTPFVWNHEPYWACTTERSP